MKVIRAEGSSRPYVENGTLYLPCIQNDTRWRELVTESVLVIVQLKWENTSVLGWVAEWIFFSAEQEIPWDEVQDKVSVARSFREWNCHPDDVIPWGDGIEALVTLERM